MSAYFMVGALITIVGVFIAQRTSKKLEKAALVGAKPGL